VTDIRYIEGKKPPEHLPASRSSGRTYQSWHPDWHPERTVEDEAGINLADILAVLRKRWRVIAGFGAGAVVLAVIACLLTTPLYTASAVIQIQVREPQVTTNIAQVDAPDMGLEFMQDQIEILESRLRRRGASVHARGATA